MNILKKLFYLAMGITTGLLLAILMLILFIFTSFYFWAYSFRLPEEPDFSVNRPFNQCMIETGDLEFCDTTYGRRSRGG